MQKQSNYTTIKRYGVKFYDNGLIKKDETFHLLKRLNLYKQLENEQKELTQDIENDKTISYKSIFQSKYQQKQEIKHNGLLQWINEDQNLSRYLSLYQFGQGASGCVKQIYDTKEKKYFAEKQFYENQNGIQEYLYEKNIMKQLQSVLNDSNMFAHLIDFNDEKGRLIYECGHCNLKELMDYKINNNQFWQEDDIIYISWKLLEMLIQLNEVSFFYSDWKPANITIFSNEQTVLTWISIIKLIDFGTTTRQFNFIKGYTPFFAPQNFDTLILDSKSKRLAFEAYQIGRTIQMLIINSEFFINVEYIEKNKFKKHDKIGTFKKKLSQQITNNQIVKLIYLCLQDNKVINTVSQQYIENMIKLMIDLKIVAIYKQILGLNRTQNWEGIQYIKKVKNELFLQNINQEQDLISNINNFEQYLMFEKALKLSYKLAKIYEYKFAQLIINKQQNDPQFENIAEKLYQLIGLINTQMMNLNHPQEYVNWYIEFINYFFKNNVKLQEEQKSNLHNFLGQAYLNIGQLLQAEEEFNLVIELLKLSYGEEHSTFATAFSNLGLIYKNQGKLKEAETQFLKANELTQKCYGEYYPSLSIIFSNLGQVYQDQGKLNEAETQFLKAIELEKKSYGEEHPNLATQFSNLGQVYQDLGKLKEAETQFLKAIELQKKSYGEEHPSLSISFSNLGGIYKEQGKLNEAEFQYLKSIQLQKSNQGEEHPSLSILFSNLGGIYKELGKMKEAETQFLKAIKLEKRSYGEEHPTLSISFSNLGGVYKEQGKFKEAETQYLKAIELQKKSYGEDHPTLATYFSNLGGVYEEQGNLKEAEMQYLKAIELEKKYYGEDHPTLSISFSNLGGVYKDQGKLKLAETQYLKAIEIEKKCYGNEHPSLAIRFNNLGGVYEDQGKLKEAETQYLKAIELEKKYYGIDHPTLAIFYSNLGCVFYQQNDYKQAETLYLKAIELSIKNYGLDHQNLATYYNNLGGVYEKQGNLKEADSCYQKAIVLENKNQQQEHPTLSISLSNQEGINKEQGNLQEIETQNLKTIESEKKSYNYEEESSLAIKSNNISGFQEDQGKLKEIEIINGYQTFNYKLLSTQFDN